MRRGVVAGLTAAVVVGVTGYAAADVAGLAPGILTYDGAPVAAPTPSDSPSATPSWAPLPAAVAPSPTPTPSAPVPTTAGLTTVLAPLVKDPWFGPSVGVTVRDGLTGEELYAVSADTPRAPASSTKVLSAFAVIRSLDLESRMTTKVVEGAKPGEIVLVAGGDTMLGEGASDPSSVAGHAGLGTLADEVAASLREQGVTSVTLRTDATYAAGPRFPAKWKQIDADEGFTQGVAMLGRAIQRPKYGTPSVAVAEDSVSGALAKLLTAKGIATKAVPLGPTDHGTPAPEGARELGAVESATYREVLDVALNVSDDALTENLVRQAMAAKGQSPAKLTAVPAFVKATLTEAGVDTAGMATLDASGLAYGQVVSATTLGDVLALASSGKEPDLRDAIAGLPVAGLTGTLAKRYQSKTTKAAAGIPRAKTGTLTGISSLAGSTVTKDGRLLTFVVLADRVPESSGTLGARAALDRFVTALTQCGCR
ncbi:D-alanyl-D-alanine carboxypeptidase/D-alanyl-D-alanine-endopeptidase (penicillin-binding protein 4) [Knoellia remsis]|uniref:D-alanyl-D-alanine carboxypeptidase/D-alanyl-D-alanine-endopeptidase (Penicillin-binding protein 4) n=1 Tax=Knoellia remsis TaxID=407159 RepID=A0A2T0UMX6_9MICO|nr:D-alanyl-D-alanine carboxypeptidase [Knoellia remsis]PRY59272.1 D-alanyl-D-alanine carboxypeptidase/D-alanyl-D-alanine-endopeptidase (penicillin-binding protein 4) [Knoellia remsis]